MVDFSLLESLQTDITVAPPQDYADSSAPNLLPEGTYDLHLKDFEPIMDRDNPSLFKGFNLQCAVADGDYAGRGTGRLSVWATPYMRQGVKVSGLGDLIRAIDATAVWENAADAARILQMAVDRKIPFRVRLGWEAFNQTGYEEAGGKTLANKSPEQKALRKQHTVKGMHQFPENPDGSYRAEYTFNNDGVEETVEARLTINNFVASHRRR